MQNAKPYEISKYLVLDAFQRVKANPGSAGLDCVSIVDYESSLKDNLYILWNRMSSGSYFPPSVKLVSIPKSQGGTRPLGIPRVEDRIAQQVVVMPLAPCIEPYFVPDSYAYRPGYSAHAALSKARERCWNSDWVLDMDIRKFFDTIDHELLMKAVRRHTSCPWVLLYIERWLKVPYALTDGSMLARDRGVAQGSVIGPLLANLFLHYTFDLWMKKYYPHLLYERYADDIVCHCATELQASDLRIAIQERFAACKLSLNEQKTHIVYCKDGRRRGDYETISFDFLGYTFRGRKSMGKRQVAFTGFLPAISNRSIERVRDTMRSWHLKRHMYFYSSLERIAIEINSVVRGWIVYYGKFYPTRLKILLEEVNDLLSRWVTAKYKRFRGKPKRAYYWLGNISVKEPTLFAHWAYGVTPTSNNKRKSHNG